MLVAQGAVAKAVQHAVVEYHAVLQDLDEGGPLVAGRRLEHSRPGGPDRRRPLRATKVASAAKAICTGWIGCSIVPSGLDLVFLPNSEVGEYCPLVRP